MKESDMINELFSKSNPSLDEIASEAGNPTPGDIYNSKDFQTNLINDLVNGKRNVASWEVYDKHGSIADLTTTDDDRFTIDYTFHFKYKYQDVLIPLTLFINGDVDVDWVGRNIGGSYHREPQSAQPQIDDNSLGRLLDLALYDDDGNEISLGWITPELEKRVVKSIVGPYL